MGLCETHLTGSETITIEIPGYRWVGNNRKNIAANAWRGSGGVGFLVSTNVLETFDLEVSNDFYDDILWTRLKLEYDPEFVINLCVAYLQPVRSSGETSLGSFSTHYWHKYTPIATHQNFSSVETSTAELEINKTLMIESTTFLGGLTSMMWKKIGDYLIEFLKDAKLCVLNGRGNDSDDSYTLVSTTGRSVVNYQIIPYNQLSSQSNFNVNLIVDIMR